ncbi:MAG: hypothetical protein PHH32_04870 [Eubacteriales bacterium]|nr:hypothetical protein [Eubacteriales bacterium]
MKRLTALLAALFLAVSGLALAEAAPAPLALAEIESFNAGVLGRAGAEEPTLRQAGDAWLALGQGYELTLSSGDISTDSVVLGAAVTLEAGQDAQLKDPRGVTVDSPVEELLKAYSNDNPYLAGNQDSAVLYIAGELPAVVYTGFVVRDGQTLSLVEYNVYHQVDGGVARAGMQYTISQGRVRAIRSFLNLVPLSQAEAQEALGRLAALQEENSVVMNAGQPGSPLEREDMEIGGLDFFDLTPETAQAVLGAPEYEEEAKSAGGTLVTLQWPGVEAVFSLEEGGKGARAERITVNAGSFDGPRGLRLGQSLAQAISLFAHGEELPVEGGTLYGEGQTPPYGTMVSGSGYVSLYYVIGSDHGAAGLVLTFMDDKLASMSLTYL